MNGLGIGADGDVLGDHREFRARVGGPLVERRFIQTLMQEQVLTHHDLRVLAGGFGQGIIPPESLQSRGGAFAVGGGEKEFLIR